MKKVTLSLLFLLIVRVVWAQVPQQISYQSVIRDGNNVVVASSPVGIKISLLKGSPTGPAVYIETHSKTTNSNGLVSLEIGTGTVVSESFASIDWANGPYLIQTETDPTGGTNYSIPAVIGLNSVPYALYAANGPQGLRGLTGQTGATGLPGAVGPQGPNGSSGQTGPQGPQGLLGPAGSSGAQGLQGIPGPIGPAGLNWKGSWSSIGSYAKDDVVGYNGASWFCIVPISNSIASPDTNSTNWALLASQGATGAEGPIGLNGPAGPQGAAGNDGVVGSQGPIGLTGPAGSIGPQGLAGSIGTTGATGPSGPQGAAGNDGIAGQTGPQGPIGLTGPAGSIGPQGAAGSTGTTGATGPAGPQGAAGIVGVAGPTGPTGPQGPTGPSGELKLASGFVDPGTFVILDNVKATLTTLNNRGLSIGAVSTSFAAHISGTYGAAASPFNDGRSTTLNFSTTASNSIFGWGFANQGDTSTYVLYDNTNVRVYRITLMIGYFFYNNFISIERLY